jgi:hypothetical protein
MGDSVNDAKPQQIKPINTTPSVSSLAKECANLGIGWGIISLS